MVHVTSLLRRIHSTRCISGHKRGTDETGEKISWLGQVQGWLPIFASTRLPEKIILFGSYAYDQPHADSDVDTLAIRPARNQRDQAFKIHGAIQPPFRKRGYCFLDWRRKLPSCSAIVP
jgi:hypothetical protein